MLTSLIPSRSIFATAREMGALLHPEKDSKFKGPGWYIIQSHVSHSGKLWILVLPSPDNPFNDGHPMRAAKHWPPNSGFVAHFYDNCPDAMLNAIANAPTRIDEIEGWEGG